MDFEHLAGEIGISVEAYKRLCTTFLRTTKEDISSLSEALKSENREEISSISHHIKGSASNMEFEEISDEAKKLQTSAFDAPLSQLKSHFERICTMFEEIEEELGEDI